MLLPSLTLSFLSLWAPQNVAEPVPQKAVDAAIDRGVEYLITQQELDGSWRFHVDRHIGGITGLCVYTLIKGGTPKNHQAVVRGVAYLNSLNPKSTYEVSAMLMAYAVTDPKRYAGRLQELTDLLVEWNEGSWSYPESHEDMSNTHFGALGLRYARASGCQIPGDLWLDVAKSLRRWQQEDGAFPYTIGGKPSLSMTAAGIGVACLTREALDGQKGKAPAALKSLDSIIQKGLTWFDDKDPVPHPEWKGNLISRRWDYYYLYGLQRVGVLTPTRLIAGKAWYQEGARWLIQKQKKAGDWGTPNGEEQPNTCLAILFLVRASAPTTGEKEPKKNVVRVQDPEADMQFVVAGQDPARVWIESIHEMHYDSWEWPADEGKGLRVQKVEYLHGDHVLATVEGNPEQPEKKARYPAELRFDKPGTYPIRVRMTLAPHPADVDEIPTIESSVLEVSIQTGLAPWMKEYLSDLDKNLLKGAKVSAKVSSQHSDHWKARHAFDGTQGRGWMCAKTDEDPWITLNLKRSIKINTILLSHARKIPTKPGLFARAQRVEVTINKRKSFTAELNLDEQLKSVITLDRPEKVRRLTLRLLDRVAGTQESSAAGFMEIEFQLR